MDNRTNKDIVGNCQNKDICGKDYSEVNSLALKSIGCNQSVCENGEDGTIFSLKSYTVVAQTLELVPGYLPGLATRHYARGLCSHQHHSEADRTMRTARRCSLSSESCIPLNTSHSHPLSSLAFLITARLPLISSWVSPPASHL